MITRDVPVDAVASNSAARIEEGVPELFDRSAISPRQAEARREAEEAVVEVIARRRPVEPAPQHVGATAPAPARERVWFAVGERWP